MLAVQGRQKARTPPRRKRTLYTTRLQYRRYLYRLNYLLLLRHTRHMTCQGCFRRENRIRELQQRIELLLEEVMDTDTDGRKLAAVCDRLTKDARSWSAAEVA